MIENPILSDAPALFWLIGGVAVFIVAVAKSGFGGAMAALSAPLMLTILPAKTALAVLLPLFLLSDIWSVWLWRGFAVKRYLFWMVLAASIGQIIGYFVIGVIDDETLKRIIGGLALFISLRYGYRMLKPHLQNIDKRGVRRRFRERSLIWCTLSGLSSFISLTGSIPVQIYMLPMRLQRFYFVGTLSWYFCLINVSKLPLFFNLEIFTPQTMLVSAWLAPIVPLGILCGWWVNKKINDKIFYHVTHFLLMLLGLYLVI